MCISRRLRKVRFCEPVTETFVISHCLQALATARRSRPRFCDLTSSIITSGLNQRVTIQVWTPSLFISLVSLSSSLDVIYPNGISCSIPEEVQEPMMRTIPGLENVKMVRPAYGVEYDHVDARELRCMFSSHLALFYASFPLYSYTRNETN